MTHPYMTHPAVSGSRPMTVAAAQTPLVFGAGFSGAIEEVFLKNVSTENRRAYMYADDNRILGTHLIGKNQSQFRNCKTPHFLVHCNPHTHALASARICAHTPAHTTIAVASATATAITTPVHLLTSATCAS